MKFVTLLFAVLAAVPQALKLIASIFFKMNKCAPGADTCSIANVDRADILNMLYGPTWFTTTGLWVGLGGMTLGFIVMQLLELRNKKLTDEIIGKAHDHKFRRDQREHGRMPRPGYAQAQGGGSHYDRLHDERPSPRNRFDDSDGRYNDRYSEEDYDPNARYRGRYRRDDER